MASQHNPSETYLLPYTSKDLFSDQIIWFVDDTCVYRITIVQNHEGLGTTPINGAMFVLNPQTGQFFVRFIHTSAWLGHVQGGLVDVEIARQRAIEEVTALINSLPIHERPNKLLITRNGMLNKYATNIPDFPNYDVIPNQLFVPIIACTQIKKFGDLIDLATESHMVVFNLYDDWLERIPLVDALARLVIILRAMNVDRIRAKVILKPDETVLTEPHHFWPTLTHEQWDYVEVQLESLIPFNYFN